MSDKLNITIKNDEKRIPFLSSNSFDKNLYNYLHLERIQKYELFLFKQFIHYYHNVLIKAIRS